MAATVHRSRDPVSGSTSDTRRRILEVALRQFETNGYEATTVRAIAEELGVTTPALYYHFANKEAILEAAVSPYLEEVHALLTAPEMDDVDPKALLAVYAGILHRHRSIARFLYRDLSASQHPLVKSVVDGQLAEFRRRLSGGSGELHVRVRVAAALGALRRPFLWLNDDIGPHLDDLVAIAAGILLDSRASAEERAAPAT